MKLFIISDTHFGKYSLDSDKWLNNMKNYFYEFFIPMIKKNRVKGVDKLFFLGDLFDNRNSIDMRAITIVVEIFEKLSKIIECHILLGNHDQRMMNDPTINSVVTIRNIPNVYVYENDTELNLEGKRIAIMPWINGKDSEKDILEKYKGSDILFCHSDLNGCRTQLYPTRPINKNILDINDFIGFNKVYSGHIHINQTINNFTFVGCPYHLDRNDINNEKGIYIHDLETNDSLFILNDYSPQFIKLQLKKDTDLINIKEQITNSNNFFDIEVSNSLLLNNDTLKLEFEKLLNKYSNNKNIENIYYINDVIEEVNDIDTDTETALNDKSIKDISFDWIDNLKINNELNFITEIDLKDKMKETIEKCYLILNSNIK